jgi:hypothetical protein
LVDTIGLVELRAPNLNSDKLDGMDAEQLQEFSTLRVSTTDVTTLGQTTGNRNGVGTASCQAGEQAISGGAQTREDDTARTFSTSNRAEYRSSTPLPVR